MKAFMIAAACLGALVSFDTLADEGDQGTSKAAATVMESAAQKPDADDLLKRLYKAMINKTFAEKLKAAPDNIKKDYVDVYNRASPNAQQPSFDAIITALSSNENDSE